LKETRSWSNNPFRLTSVSALRESALAAAGVRGIFKNLIDGKSVGARNTLDVLDPATGELLAKVPDIEREGMDAAFRGPPAEPFPRGAN